MKSYLETDFDLNDPTLVSTSDELPLWSAPFGIVLLESLPMAHDLYVLDIGPGTGFPMLEIAQRLGKGAQVVGLDPWTAAAKRVELKAEQYGIPNVRMVTGFAERLPFQERCFDLVVSNNGLNNVQDLDRVFIECARVTKTRAELVLTVNLPQTMHEFYLVFQQVLAQLGLSEAIERMRAHIQRKRLSVEEWEKRISQGGFEIQNTQFHQFKMRFIDGSTFLSHYFIRLAFLASWKKIPDANRKQDVFRRLEEALNEVASQNGELALSIPFACIHAIKRP